MFSKKKILAGVIPVGLVAAVAAVAMAIVPAGASAAACTGNVLCNNANEALRDDLVTPPEGVSGGGYGTSALAVNTKGPLQLCVTIAAKKECNENPTGYAFFGVKLHSDPVTSTTKCEEAEGWVQFVDVQHATFKGASSPVYDNTSPGYNGPWSIGVKSDNTGCEAAVRGKVTIEKAALFFPVLGLKVTGTFVGKWVQPENTTTKERLCSGGSGGVELEIAQPGLTVNVGEKPEVQEATGAKAFLCFVSANNNLFPTTAPVWAPFTGDLWKD